MNKFAIIIFLIFSLISNNIYAFEYEDSERQILLEYSIKNKSNNDFRVRFNEVNNNNLTNSEFNNRKTISNQVSLSNPQLNYSNYQNVQGYKNNNKSFHKKFFAASIAIIVTGITLTAVLVGSLINAID